MNSVSLEAFAIVYPPGCIDSTPYSHSAASMTQFGERLKPVDALDQFLLEDLKFTRVVSNENFLRGLGLSENVATQKEKDKAVEKVIEDMEVIKQFEEYGKPVAEEKDRYGPFCDLVNRCLDLLWLRGLRFSRVDPQCIHGFRGSLRKPDVAAINGDNPFVANGRWRTCSTIGPPKVDQITLLWKDIKLLWEFKLKKERLKPMAQVDHLEPMLSVPPVLMPLSEIEAAQLGEGSRSKSAVKVTRASTSGLKRMQEETDFDSTGRPKRRRVEGYPRQKKATLELRLGGVRYAADTLTHCPNRRHCIEGLVLDSVIFMAYYDRAGPVLAKGFDFGLNRYLFVLLLKTLAQLDDADLGFMQFMEDMSEASDDAIPTLPMRHNVISDRDVTPASAGCVYPLVPHGVGAGRRASAHTPPISDELAYESGGGADNTDDERRLQSTPVASPGTPAKPEDVDNKMLRYRVFGGSSPLTSPPSSNVLGGGDVPETSSATRAENVLGTNAPADDVFSGSLSHSSLLNLQFPSKLAETDSTSESEGSSDDELGGLELVERSSDRKPDANDIPEQMAEPEETVPRSDKRFDRVMPATSNEPPEEGTFEDELHGPALIHSFTGSNDNEIPERTDEGKEAEPPSDKGPIHVPSSVGGKVADERLKPDWKIVVKNHELFLFHMVDNRLPYGVVTRGGRVYFALAPKFDPKTPLRPYVVKLNWPYSRRPHEGQIIETGRAALARREMDPEFKKRYGNRKLSNSLAQVFLYDELDRLAGNDTFRWRVFGEEFDMDRSLRLLMLEYLFPLHSLDNLDHFKQAVRDIVLAHHFLAVSEERILHRDISADNLMVRQVGNDICGVLNDLDLAMVGDPSADRHHGARTGTRPFMALELFNKDGPAPLHLERFDWESFFYVIYWIACRYNAGKLVDREALTDWYSPNTKLLKHEKRDALLGQGDEEVRKFQPFYEPLEDAWIEPLREMFNDGNRRKVAFYKKPTPGVQFDYVTNGGQITWERFWKILEN